MTRRLVFIVATLTAIAGIGAQEAPEGLVFVEGGVFKNTRSSHHGRNAALSDFYIGRYEVTQKEWTEVMGANPSDFKGDNLPVEMVSWYECIDYCNKRSLKEGLQPYYTIDKDNHDPDNHNENDDVKWTVTTHAGANGYRLPTEVEWEYAASGGQVSKSYRYSGSDEVDTVAWYWQNSGNEPLSGMWNWPAIERNQGRTQAVGGKAPNELGIHDMSGNVREWCWDWYVETDGEAAPENQGGFVRVWKGGGWLGGDFCCESSFRSSFEANSRGYDQGFRVCRGK